MKILIIALLVIITYFALGIAFGLYYSSLPVHHPQKNKDSCENVGGEWMNSRCYLSNKKSGESCTDSAQCESSVCSPPVLTKEQEKYLDNNTINNITGVCYFGEPTGCVEQVLMGVISKESMCLSE